MTDALDHVNAAIAELEAARALLQPSAEIPLYGQRNMPWSGDFLGYSPTVTIGDYGCLLCDVAMLVSHAYGEEITPPMVNERMKAVGGFVAGEGRMYLSKVWEAYPKLKGGGLWRYPYPLSADMSHVDDALERGAYVVVQVDFYPTTTTLNEHWVLVTEKLSDEAYMINDPWTSGRHQMPPAYAKPGWPPEYCVFCIVIYEVKDA